MEKRGPPVVTREVLMDEVELQELKLSSSKIIQRNINYAKVAIETSEVKKVTI